MPVNISKDLLRRFKQWTAKGEAAPKRAKTVLSAGRVMAIVFWDSHEIFFIDVYEKDKIKTTKYYALLLDELKTKLAKRGTLAKRKMSCSINITHRSRIPVQID